MIDRKELANEIILRESVRGAIKIVLNKRKLRISENQTNDIELRKIINNVIKEAQTAVASVAKHDSTGINALEDLLKNTRIIKINCDFKGTAFLRMRYILTRDPFQYSIK